MALQEELESQGNWLFRRRSLLPLIVLFVGRTEEHLRALVKDVTAAIS